MAGPIIYKAAAEAEIEEAYIAYETIRRGLGVEFLDELRRVETHLHTNPALYQRVEGDVRRAVLRRFPYGVFYVVDGEQVNVLGCLDLRRDPRSRSELRTRQEGIDEEVRRALLRVNPSFSAAKFAAGHAFKDADKRRLFGEHLVLAGLPE